MGLRHLHRWRLVLALWLWPMAGLWAAPQMKEQVFAVTLDRSVRQGLAVYSDEGRPVIHVYNNGNVPEQIVDGLTGQPWPGGLDGRHRLRRVYEYESEAEPPDSYLSRMKCREWRVCTGLEGVTFVVMARPGPARSQLQFRVLQFDELFAGLERALAGQLHEAPLTLSAEESAALEEVSRDSWRWRWRDALRSISTPEQYRRLQESPWLRLLAGTGVLRHVAADGFPLQRELDLAACRAEVVPLKAALIKAEPHSGQAMAQAVRGCQKSGYHFYIHIVDWLMDASREERAQMARTLSAAGDSLRDEDLRQLGRFLSGLEGPALTRTAETSPPSVATKKPEPRPPAKPRNDVERAPVARPGLESVIEADPALELAAIRALGNHLVLLSFNERDGLVTPDTGSLSGTVFRTTVEGGNLSAGAFRIEALRNPKSSVRMAVGRYRVKLKVSLFVARVDRCVHKIYCLARPGEVRSSKTLLEQAEFDLRPDNGFRDTRLVRFGPLKPTAGDETAIYQSQLSEVRLVIELDGRILPH